MKRQRPSSNELPGDQSSETPSGKQVPMAMSMMVDSMVRMIQTGNYSQNDMNSMTTSEKNHAD